MTAEPDANAESETRSFAPSAQSLAASRTGAAPTAVAIDSARKMAIWLERMNIKSLDVQPDYLSE
jgi:hypothetical protein